MQFSQTHRSGLGKMAEVSQRLGNRAFRLTTLRTSQGLPTGTRVSQEYRLICSTSSQVEEELAEYQYGNPLRLKSKETRRKVEKLSKVRKTRLYYSAGVFTENPLCTMSPWTRVVPCHPDIIGHLQQQRAFCTIVLILAEQVWERQGSRLRRLRPHPDHLKVSSTIRSYSGKSEEGALLHRSRTAYYDILKVSPSATQAQIKTAYYKQSFIYHPDKNPEDKEATQRFSEISEAYTVLGNISLRRKYDRGFLNQSDVQSAGKPSFKETKSKSTSSQQQRARKFSQTREKPMFDFDAFYQAHYGEQLQREREIRARKLEMEKIQQQKQSRWREKKMMEVALTAVLAMAGLIFINLSKP